MFTANRSARESSEFPAVLVSPEHWGKNLRVDLSIGPTRIHSPSFGVYFACGLHLPPESQSHNGALSLSGLAVCMQHCSGLVRLITGYELQNHSRLIDKPIQALWWKWMWSPLVNREIHLIHHRASLGGIPKDQASDVAHLVMEMHSAAPLEVVMHLQCYQWCNMFLHHDILLHPERFIWRQIYANLTDICSDKSRINMHKLCYDLEVP